MNDGRKRKAQKHQNKAAFKVMFDPQAEEVHKKVSFRGLCKRCADQLTWKIKYNKYKKMTEPAKCTLCNQKNVLRSYMHACEKCSTDNNVCPKCLDVESEEQKEVKLSELEEKKQHEQAEKKMNDFIKGLKERSRRTVRRLYEKGKIEWKNQQGIFVDQEGQPLVLKYKGGLGDKSQFSGDNDEEEDIDEFGDDESDEEAQKIKEEKVKKIQKIENPKQNKQEAQEDQIEDEYQQCKSDPEQQPCTHEQKPPANISQS